MTLSIVEYIDEDTKQTVKGLQVGDAIFDWGTDPEALKSASKFASEDAASYRGIVADIIKHFIDSFADFTGHRYSLKEINAAIKAGVIEVKEEACTS